MIDRLVGAPEPSSEFQDEGICCPGIAEFQRRRYRRFARQGLARAGNARVRPSMIQLAWRFLRFHPDSGLAMWFKARTADDRQSIRKTMIVALARKRLIVLWRMVTIGEVPAALTLRHAA